MNDALHVGGFADGRGVDLVVSEPKGRVVSLYRGNDGDIALTVEEARFLSEALPAGSARDDYLKHMGPLLDLVSKPEPLNETKNQLAPARRAQLKMQICCGAATRGRGSVFLPIAMAAAQKPLLFGFNAWASQIPKTGLPHDSHCIQF